MDVQLKVLRALGQNPNETELKEIMSKFTDKVSWDEFIALFPTLDYKDPINDDDMNAMWDVFGGGDSIPLDDFKKGPFQYFSSTHFSVKMAKVNCCTLHCVWCAAPQVSNRWVTKFQMQNLLSWYHNKNWMGRLVKNNSRPS